MAGCGKTVAADTARELGLPVVNMGDVVRREAIERNLPSTDESIGRLAGELREEHGASVIAARCIPLIRDTGCELVVVDGIRSMDEVDTFRNEFGEDMLLVRIEAPTELRRQRLSSRERADDTELDMDARDARELGWGMGDAMKAADVELDNSGDIDKFKKVVSKLIGEYLYIATVAVVIYPTEEIELVYDAVRKLFGDADIEFECEVNGYELHSGDVSLIELHRLLRKQRILDTARKELLKNMEEGNSVVHFNKQAASVVKVSFAADEGPLGNIALRIDCERIQNLIDWLAPRTKGGRPVNEVGFP
jgi:predicted RNA binding protein with dsRBD fold (UPF0201 family)/dephospho-CoA kinase